LKPSRKRKKQNRIHQKSRGEPQKRLGGQGGEDKKKEGGRKKQTNSAHGFTTKPKLRRTSCRGWEALSGERDEKGSKQRVRGIGRLTRSRYVTARLGGVKFKGTVGVLNGKSRLLTEKIG